MHARSTATVAAVVLLAVAGAPAAAAESDGYDTLVGHYEEIRLALLDDRMDGVAEEATALARGARALAADFVAAEAGVPPGAGEEAERMLPELWSAAEVLAAAGDLAEARTAFGALSEPLLRYRELAGDTEVKVAHCPMAGKSWLQKDRETIGNPYYGQSMARCGTFQED